MNIDEFYEYAKNLNISNKGGWSPYYYGIFSNVIKENNYKHIVEIGVGYGTHASSILINNPEIENLTLIDPMKYYDNDMFAYDVQNKKSVLNKNNFDRLYELINRDLSKISKKYKWIRKESYLITDNEIPNNSIDAIFIDGDHSYNAVLKDLEKYWEKIKQGGQMLGDDYIMPDVKKAVNTFANNKGLQFDFLYKHNSDYPIFRFIKN